MMKTPAMCVVVVFFFFLTIFSSASWADQLE